MSTLRLFVLALLVGVSLPSSQLFSSVVSPASSSSLPAPFSLARLPDDSGSSEPAYISPHHHPQQQDVMATATLGNAGHHSFEAPLPDNPGRQLKAPLVTESAALPADAEGRLIVSPYSSRPHLLDLSKEDRASQLLAKALTVLKCLRHDYGKAPYTGLFNWPEVLAELRMLLSNETDVQWQRRDFYIVAFRSQIPATTAPSELGALDVLAHSEAMEGGGLLKYWFGVADKDGHNLATCVWSSIEAAKFGRKGPHHRRAVREGRRLYSKIRIERLRLTIGHDAATFTIQPWSNPASDFAFKTAIAVGFLAAKTPLGRFMN